MLPFYLFAFSYKTYYNVHLLLKISFILLRQKSRVFQTLPSGRVPAPCWADPSDRGRVSSPQELLCFFLSWLQKVWSCSRSSISVTCQHSEEDKYKSRGMHNLTTQLFLLRLWMIKRQTRIFTISCSLWNIGFKMQFKSLPGPRRINDSDFEEKILKDF